MSKIIIPPTVGRVVLFYPAADRWAGYTFAVGQAHAAQIALAHNDHYVNLGVLDQQGRHLALQEVPLLQADDLIPDADHCRWMPYQVGQARKEVA